jgi:FMN phosphatase YigB (HAD superfamily)
VAPVRVLLFDVFGTLVDWRSSLIGIAETTAAGAGLQADWPAVVDDWRRVPARAGPGPIFIRRPLEWGPGGPPADPPPLAGLLEADGLTRLAEALGC